MEIQFQQQQKEIKSRKRKARSNNNKYIGVRQRPSGRWVAEIKDTTQKIRMWLGTFESAEEAARAYDEAACLLRGSNTRTNFLTNHVSSDSPLASRITTLLNANKTNNTNNSSGAGTDTDAKPPLPKKQKQQTSTSSSSSSSSSNSSKCRSSDGDSQLCDDGDDVYKPELEWGFDRFSFAQEMLELPNPSMNLESWESSEMVEFERIKVERQISASLYAINGVQEYMDTVFDPTDAFWDLPLLSPLPC